MIEQPNKDDQAGGTGPNGHNGKAHGRRKAKAADRPDYGRFLDQELIPRLTVDAVFTDPAHQFQLSGDKVRGGCPWHESKSGTAFYADTKTLRWRCPACQVGGGPLQYRWRLAGNRTPSPRGADFIAAVRDLSQLAGVAFPEAELTREEREHLRRRETRRAVLESVVALCERCLWAAKNKWAEKAAKAREYLTGRGFADAELRELRVGLYPPTDRLETILLEQGHAPEDINDSCAVFPKMTGYTTWPWNDDAGALLTIYGKWPGKGHSPKTMALPNAKDDKGVVWEYTKRSPLYFDRAVKAGQRDLVLVEGPTDAALPMLRGDPRMIACVAAELSDLQVKTLKRHGAHSVIVALDPDPGGEGGVQSCIRQLQAVGIRPFVAPTFPDGLDPDDFFLREGMEGWKAHISRAVHGYRHCARLLVEKHSERQPGDDLWLDGLIEKAVAFAEKQPRGSEGDLRLYFWPVIAKATGATVDDLARRASPGKGGADAEAGNHGDAPSQDDTLHVAASPKIDAGTGELAEITAAAWGALRKANDPPSIFRYGAIPARIEYDDGDNPLVRSLDQNRMRHRLARCAQWYVIVKEGKEEVEKAVHPPMDVVRDVLATPDQPLPVLTRVVECPVFAADGTLQTMPGYSPAGRTYYAPAAGFGVPEVSPHPSAAEVKEAVRWLADELIGEFPFVADADKAHALSALLLPFARDMIGGATPIHDFEAPGPGTGKTLLVEGVMYPALGRPATAMTEGKDEDEWRKRVLAKLMGAPSIVFIDNVRRRVDSGALASAVTAYPLWEDRVLGKSEIVRVPVRCAWMLTGNNPAFSNEMSRRVVRCRLDAKIDQPWLREGYRHPDLKEWALENRGRLVWAALTLIQAWIAEGRPAGDNTLGMFESWARTMGGILDVAGVKGFLGNLQEFYASADAEGATWRAFVEAWWAAHRDNEVKAAELYALAVDAGMPLGDKSEQSQKVHLGQKIAEARDRVFRIELGDNKHGNLRVEQSGVAKRAALWKLTAIEQ